MIPGEGGHCIRAVAQHGAHTVSTVGSIFARRADRGGHSRVAAPSRSLVAQSFRGELGPDRVRAAWPRVAPRRRSEARREEADDLLEPLMRWFLRTVGR